MNAFHKTLAAATLGLSAIATSVAADDLASAQTVYDIFLDPSAETHATFLAATSADWTSFAAYSGKYSVRKDHLHISKDITALVPDLGFVTEAIHQDDDFVPVCGCSIATSASAFTGSAPEDRSFDIMNSDIHE